MKPVRPLELTCCAFAFAALLGTAQLQAQPQLTEELVLTFSAPVQIPGAMLQPGKYVFKLGPSPSSQHIVQVFTEDGRKLIATTLTVPKERRDSKGDVVMTFAAAAAGSPPALQAYFYPGTLRGHEFVYPERQAREIAMRTRTLVLSHDIEGTDFESATLRVFNERGEPQNYVASHPADRPGATTEERTSTAAPLIMAERLGTRVSFDDLEDNPAKYMGRQVSVDAEVDDVLGPRLFTIEAPGWDLDGEILVFMRSGLAALVAENDQVTISGTMQPLVRAQLEAEWRWLGIDDADVDLSIESVLVADRLIGGNENLAVVIAAEPSVVGTGGRAEPAAAAKPATRGTGAPLTTVVAVASAPRTSVGRAVSIKNVVVDAVAAGGGFWVRGPQGRRVFVLPIDRDAHKLKAGQRVSIDGLVLQMPRSMKQRVAAGDPQPAAVYVHATTVTM